MSFLKKKESKMSWKPVAGITTLRKQIDDRWPKRDKRSDGIVGDSAHSARKSDHNPDSRGYVHALDIDEDLRGSKMDSEWLARQIIAYARNKRPGSSRLKYVVYEDRIASGSYPRQFWTWRNGDWGHEHHMHVSFTKEGEQDGSKFDIPILIDGEIGVWDGYIPFFDVLEDSIASGARNKATWRLACRLKELGFYSGKVAPDGEQAYPKNAIRAMQDWMGWERREYDEKAHKAIFGKVPFSKNDDYEPRPKESAPTYCKDCPCKPS
jgi:hypothetical protein